MTRFAPILILLLSCAKVPTSSPLDELVPRIMQEDRIPGAVIVVGSTKGVTYRKAFGTASPNTLFDLASLTKVVATTTAALKLVEEGRLSLDDPVGERLAVFADRDVTIRDLLVHRSGLPPYLNPKASTCDGILEEISLLKRPKTYAYG